MKDAGPLPELAGRLTEQQRYAFDAALRSYERDVTSYEAGTHCFLWGVDKIRCTNPRFDSSDPTGRIDRFGGKMCVVFRCCNCRQYVEFSIATGAKNS